VWWRRETYSGFWWGNLEERRPLGRHNEDIRMDLQEVGYGGMDDWIKVAQDRDWWQALMNEVMNLQVA